MRAITGEGLGRIVILTFEKGEKLLEGIRNKIREMGIKNAVVISGIGTFSNAHIHRVTSFEDKPEEEFIKYSQPIELSSVDGVIANYEPHLHMTFTDLEHTYSGHLEDDTVILYLAEIVIVELKGIELKREFAGNVKLLKEERT